MQERNSIELTARIVLGANLSLADVLFSIQPEIYKLHETQRGGRLYSLPCFSLKRLPCQLEILDCHLKFILIRMHLFLQRQGDSLFG